MQISKHKNYKVLNDASNPENYKAPTDQELGQLKTMISIELKLLPRFIHQLNVIKCFDFQ